MLQAQGFRGFLLELRRQGVRFLITSRCELGGGMQRAEHLHLVSLPGKHAAELLRQEAGPERVTPLQAQKLASICGNNALALTLISGIIASQAITAEVRWPLQHHIALGMKMTAASMHRQPFLLLRVKQLAVLTGPSHGSLPLMLLVSCLTSSEYDLEGARRRKQSTTPVKPAFAASVLARRRHLRITVPL